MAKKKLKSISTDKHKAKMLILAGLFLGIGFGMIIDNTGAGTLIGLGAGFLATWYVESR